MHLLRRKDVPRRSEPDINLPVVYVNRRGGNMLPVATAVLLSRETAPIGRTGAGYHALPADPTTRFLPTQRARSPEGERGPA